MISQPKWNYVFVAVPKTGTSSMRDRLIRLGTANYDRPQHLNIQEYRQILGDALDSRFKFAFVRNPWSRLVSDFTMRTRGIMPSLPREWNGDAVQFQKWARTQSKRPQPDSRAIWTCGQLDRLLDADGKLDVDFIGRFENIKADFRTVLERINDIHPLPSEKHWRLPLHNASNNSKHYSEYYNDETIELVREHFLPDIEEFNYTYEKAPG
jgi:hypothetical protein